VKNRFQSLPFKCDLQRYSEALGVVARLEKDKVERGLYKLDVVGLSLKGAWFQPLNL
jgi:hypothetical protein